MRRNRHARHLAKIEQYVYTPQLDRTRPNAYAMVIGAPPGAAIRPIGEVGRGLARRPGFVAIEAFCAAFGPGKKLTKIFVAVDSVGNVERVVQDHKDRNGMASVRAGSAWHRSIAAFPASSSAGSSVERPTGGGGSGCCPPGWESRRSLECS